MNINSIAIIVLFSVLWSSSGASQTALPTIDLNTFQWGLKDSATAKIITRATYDHISSFKNGMAITKVEDRYGLINPKGKVLFEPVYQYLRWVNDDLIKLKKDDQFGLMNSKLEVVMPFRFESLLVYGDYLVVNNGLKSGIIDLAGNIMIPFEYDEILIEYSSEEGSGLNQYHIRVGIDGKYGVIDYKNELIIPMVYNSIQFWPKGIVHVSLDNSDALLDKDGKVLIDSGKYRFSDPIANDLIVAEKEGQYGFVDLKGKIIVPFIYEKAHGFQYGMATAEKKGVWGAINERNQIVIPFLYNRAILFSNGIAPLEKKTDSIKKFAFLNSERERITDFIYDEATKFNQNFAQVRRGDKWGLVNKEGEEILAVRYDKVMVRYGHVVTSIQEKYGLYELDGTPILEDEYSFVYPSWDDPFIMVREGRKYGYVDRSGKVVIPIIYENARNFSGDRASVLLERESFEIDRNGDRIGTVEKLR